MCFKINRIVLDKIGFVESVRNFSSKNCLCSLVEVCVIIFGNFIYVFNNLEVELCLKN